MLVFLFFIFSLWYLFFLFKKCFLLILFHGSKGMLELKKTAQQEGIEGVKNVTNLLCTWLLG